MYNNSQKQNRYFGFAVFDDMTFVKNAIIPMNLTANHIHKQTHTSHRNSHKTHIISIHRTARKLTVLITGNHSKLHCNHPISTCSYLWSHETNCGYAFIPKFSAVNLMHWLYQHFYTNRL